MNTVLRAIFSVYQFLLLLLSWIIAWLLQEITKLVLLPFTNKHQRHWYCSKIFRALNQISMDHLNPFWTINILKGMPPIKPDDKYIVMLNHLSNADPWVILRLFVFSRFDWRFVCKGSLFKVPFGGWALANNGDVAVKFTKEKNGWGTEKGSVKVLMQDSVDIIENGAALAVFPEGVRNPKPEGEMSEFKQGYFDLAVEKGYKILPIAISGSETCWPVHDWKLDSATVYITCADALISPQGHDGASLKDLVYKKITEMRETHPDRQALAAKKKKGE